MTLLLLLLAGCDGPTKDIQEDSPSSDDSGGPDDTSAPADDWCGVQSILANDCASCHSAAAHSGGLDLHTDPYAALVGAASGLYDGRTLVVAGDPDASFVLAKMAGTQGGSEGTPMPPPSGAAAADLEVVRAWIAAGATDVCESPDTGPVDDGYHPAGWEAPTEHGMAAKHQQDDCLSCHGDDLTGGTSGISCDTCHDAVDASDAVGAWRTDCTWCHGGLDNESGAPPEGISDEIDASDTTFPPHTTHVEATALKSALDCVQCHAKPTDIFSAGHLFLGDATPSIAETSFGLGLSDAGRWSAGTCSNLYCHGNGRGENGTVSTTESVACGDCHAVTASGDDAWEGMSGEHEEHIDEGVRCAECHGDVVSSAEAILDVSLHVDGTAQVSLPAGMSRSGNTCTGNCHTEGHASEPW